jgi:hypothetical protein
MSEEVSCVQTNISLLIKEKFKYIVEHFDMTKDIEQSPKQMNTFGLSFIPLGIKRLISVI